MSWLSLAIDPVGNPGAIACTLEPTARAERLAEWAELAGRAVARYAIADGVGLRFDRRIDLGELVDLVGRELACCGYLAFALDVDRRGIGLEIRAPSGAGKTVAALLGDSPA